SRLKADAANTQSISPTLTATPSNITVTSQRRESFEGPRNQKKFQLFTEPPSGDVAAAPRCQILAIREGLFGLEKNRMIQTGEKAAEGRVVLRSGKLRPQRGPAAILKVAK